MGDHRGRNRRTAAAGAGVATLARRAPAGPGNRAMGAILRDPDAAPDRTTVEAVGRFAGNRAATMLVQRRRSGADGARSQAAERGVPDARTVIALQMPFLLPILTDAQVAQIQRSMDAAALNPEIEARARAIDARATKTYGSLQVVDKGLSEQAFRLRRQKVSTGASERRIRLPWERLFSSDVMAATKGDRDEMKFLRALRARLDRTGIWLRVGEGANPELWYSLGPDGDTVPSFGGLITRETLLQTTTLGAMYYRMIYQGQRYQEVDAELGRLGSFLQDGMAEYERQRGNRITAAPLVVPIVDWLGDAEFPDESTWEVPWKTYLKAMDAMATRDLELASLLAVVAGYGATSAGEVLAAYADATAAGAGKAVTWLRRVEIAAAVVGTIAGGYWALGAVSGAGAAGAAGAEVAGGAELGALSRNMDLALREYPAFARELSQVRAVLGPAGPVTNGLKKELIGLGMGKFF